MFDLKKYIKENKKRGYTDQQITDYLLRLGYSKQIINQAYNNLKSKTKIYLSLALLVLLILSGVFYFFITPNEDTSGNLKESAFSTKEKQTIDSLSSIDMYCNELDKLGPITGIISNEFFASEEGQYSEFFITLDIDKPGLVEKCLPLLNLANIHFSMSSFGDVDFYLINPNREKITKFEGDPMIKTYEEQNPRDGVWKIMANVREVVESQLIINVVGKVNNINIKSDMRAGYEPDEDIPLRAKVYFDKGYELNGKVEALVYSGLDYNAPISEMIFKPIKKIELFDDGQHNDDKASDGIFGNSITLEEQKDYPIKFRLIGLIGNMEILREENSQFWIADSNI